MSEHTHALNALPPLPRRLALVGVAKNSGKTTTLNAIMALALSRGQRVGLVSVGIDGEGQDALLGTHKPGIELPEGGWAVTAEAMLSRSTARVELVDTLGYETPLGEVVLVRAVDPGSIVLAGVRRRDELTRALDALTRHGAPDTILIDGAYGRRVAAHANLSDATLLSTGAIVSSDVAELTAITHDLAARLTLPTPPEPWQRDLLDAAIREDRALLGASGRPPEPLPRRSALLGLPAARDRWATHTAIAIPGLISDRVVEELLLVPRAPEAPPRALLVADGTSVQCSRKHLARLRRVWAVHAHARTALYALSANPSSIAGPPVPEDALLTALREAHPDTPVFNPRSGAGWFG